MILKELREVACISAMIQLFIGILETNKKDLSITIIIIIIVVVVVVVVILIISDTVVVKTVDNHYKNLCFTTTNCITRDCYYS